LKKTIGMADVARFVASARVHGGARKRGSVAGLCGRHLFFASSVLVRAETDEKGFVRTRPEQLDWKIPFPGATPLALLEGDPSKPGIYVLRVQFPPYLFDRPHKHGEDRLIVVLKGTWYMGTGEHFDPSKAVPMPVGSYIKHPAGEWHWDGAKDEEVVLQVAGYGPSSTELLVKDAPMFLQISP
jgi:quercetin dioxygenase-like cupin family protein